MRVAYVSADPGVPVFGRKGSSVHVQGVVRALRRRGDEVVIFTARRGGDAPADLADVGVVDLPRAKSRDPAERERALRTFDADLANALAVHGPFDLVYERYSLWSTAGMAGAARTVLEVNAPLVDEQALHRTLVDRPAAERGAVTAIRRAGLVVCISEQVAEWVRGLVPDARLAVVPNGVDRDRVWRGPRLHDDGFTVGFVGTLKPWHGLDVLADAYAELATNGDGWHLLVVGDGPHGEPLRRRLERLGVDGSVTWTGSVDPADVVLHLARMDVAVAPYPARDGFYFSPLKVLEYLAAGVPVVASAVGEVPALVEHGRTGLLVEPGDATALAQALWMLRADERLRDRLAAAAPTAVRGRTWDDVVATILRLSVPAGVR